LDCESLGFCLPCRRPLESSGSEGDCRGFIRGPFCGGANLADGEGRDEGDSSDSSRCRGEIKECGVPLDLGDTEGFGDAVTVGAALAFGELVGRSEEHTSELQSRI